MFRGVLFFFLVLMPERHWPIPRVSLGVTHERGTPRNQEMAAQGDGGARHEAREESESAPCSM